MKSGNRWEWRVFSPEFPAVPQGWLQAAEATEPSHEEYLISLASPQNVKIREGLLDIKHLVTRGESGLEQWRAVLKHEFPLDSRTVHVLWKTWGLPSPITGSNRCSHEQLLETIRGEPLLAAVPVTKKRARIRAGKCDGEFTLIETGGEKWQTLAVESLNPDDVIIAVNELGFETASNTNYPAALKAIIARGTEEILVTTEAK